MPLSQRAHWMLQEVIAWTGSITALGTLYYLFYGRNNLQPAGECTMGKRAPSPAGRITRHYHLRVHYLTDSPHTPPSMPTTRIHPTSPAASRRIAVKDLLEEEKRIGAAGTASPQHR
jgi:hypothetical protein